MNRLKKTFTIDQGDFLLKYPKKHFSFFKSTSIPEPELILEISLPCVEHPPELHSANAATSFQNVPRSRPVQYQRGNSNTPSQNQRSLCEKKSIQEDNHLLMGMKCHEQGEIEKGTYYWRLSAEKNTPLGLLLYGIALRHGWGCKKEPRKAVVYLQSAAEYAVSDLQQGIAQSVSIAKSELVLAIYELGICFRHGWGVPKNLETAAYYFQIASNLGDPDAQNDLGFCYTRGLGVKKDLYLAAKYYRLAEKQGQGIVGNSWIWKEKYNKVEEPEWNGGILSK